MLTEAKIVLVPTTTVIFDEDNRFDGPASPASDAMWDSMMPGLLLWQGHNSTQSLIRCIR
jgi:hypothetical protein